MSVTAMLLTAEVRPTAGGSGETPLQGRKSMVVTAVSTPGSGAHSAWAAPSTQRQGPGEEASFVIPTSTDRVKRQATGPPLPPAPPSPLRGLEPGPQGEQDLWGPRAQGVGHGLQGPPWGPAGPAQGTGRRVGSPGRPRRGLVAHSGFCRLSSPTPWMTAPPAHWRPLCILSCGLRSMAPYLSTNSRADTARGLQPLAPSLYFGENVNVNYI